MVCITYRRSWDLILAVAHTSQAVFYTVAAVLPFFHAGLVPVTFQVPNGRPGVNSTGYNIEELFSANIVAIVAVFFYITGLFHALRAYMGESIPGFDELLTNKAPQGSNEILAKVATRRDRDRMLRWIEYSISSTLMIYTISLISGISDIYTLAGFGAANIAMVLFGMAGDLVKERSSMWYTFVMGSIAGIAPWICILSQTIVLAIRVGAAALPFTLSIVTTLFVLFFSFAVVEGVYIYSYTSVNKVDPEGKPQSGLRFVLEGEKTREQSEFAYQILSAVAKTTLGGLVAGAMLTV